MNKTAHFKRRSFFEAIRANLAPVALLCTPFILQAQSSVPPDSEDPPQQTEPQDQKEASGIVGFVADAASVFLEHHEANLFGRPHTIQALPLIYLDFRTGWNLGFRSIIHANGRRPYLYRLGLQVLASHKGSHKHELSFDYPHISETPFGIVLRAAWRRDLEARYFGLGNNSSNDQELTDTGSANFIDDDFYLYNLKQPRIRVHGTYEFRPKISFWFGFGLESVDPQLKKGRDTSFLAQDQPFGFLGGSTRLLSFRLSWDTRNDETYPTTGFLTEFTFEPNFVSVTEEVETNGGARISEDVTFYRYTLSDARFIPIVSERLTLANRAVFEAIAGHAPYFAYGHAAGQHRTRTLGGSQSLRGFQSRRFQDKFKMFTLTELRFHCQRFQFVGQTFDVILMTFLDTGRVWSAWSEISFENFHTTFGGGLWVNWNKNLIFRLDVGRSSEEIIPYLRLNTAF